MSEVVDLTTLALLANGSDVSENYELLSIEVEKEVFRVARAQVTLRDGSAPDEDFPASAASDFAPGSDLEIRAGYQGTNATIFKGIIWGQRLRMVGGNSTVLVLDCRDRAVKATVRRRFACFSQQTDPAVIQSCLGTYGLTVKVPGASAAHAILTQWDASDWDFAMIRAQVNGWIAYAEDGVVTVASPDPGGQPCLSVTFGEDLLGFDVRLDALRQIGSSEADAWNPATLQVGSASASAANANPLGSDSSSTLAATVSGDALPLKTAAEVDSSELNGFAKAAITWAELGKVTGTLRFQGSSLVHPGGVLQIDGLGKRFNGRGFVGGLRHDIRQGTWTTEVKLGVDPRWFASRPEVSGPPATGLVPPIRGLQYGIVKAITNDPDSAYRVQVEIPLLESASKLQWARLANFYASNQFGDFFYPEIGDEVVLGFVNEDPRFPIIVGFLYSKSRPPAFQPDDSNIHKAIVTRTGLRLVFDEEKKSILVQTPAGNQALFSDDQKSIEIVDQTGNSLKMTTSGITVKSPGAIEVSATGGITIKSETDQVQVQGTQGVSVKGLTVSLTADTEFSATGNATASVKSSGETSIQGTLVMIN